MPDGHSAANAFVLANDAFPYTHTEDPGDAGGGNAHDMWFRIDPSADYRTFGALAWTADPNQYLPDLSLYSGDDPGSLVADGFLGFGIGDIAPAAFVALPDTTYWIKVEDINAWVSGNELVMRIEQGAEDTFAPVGSIFIPSDKEDSVNVILDKDTGEVLRAFGNFPPGETGAILPDGTIMVEDSLHHTLEIYDNQLNHLASAVTPVMGNSLNHPPITQDGTHFYAVGYTQDGGMGVCHVRVKEYDVDGTVVDSWSFDLPNSASVASIAITRDGSQVLLLARSDSARGVDRYDLFNDTPLTNFIAVANDPTGYSVKEIYFLDDGTVIRGFTINSASAQVRKYSAVGTLVWTSPLSTAADYPGKSFVLDHFTPGETDETFVAWMQTTDGGVFKTVTTFITCDTSDGSELRRVTDLQTFNSKIGWFGSLTDPTYQSDIEVFGNESSCPMFVMRFALGEEITIPPVEVPLEVGPNTTSIDSLCEFIIRRLGDPDHRIWSNDEIDLYIQQAMKEMCLQTRIIWDWVYLENLPRGFSFNHAWEKDIIDQGDVVSGAIWKYGPGDGMGDGQANYTYEDERREYVRLAQDSQTKADEDIREGPARHTFPDEIPFLALLGSDQQAATQNLPHRLTELERSTWDFRTIEANDHAFVHVEDNVYEQQFGEVFEYTVKKDGVRSYRKIRIPSKLAEVYEIDGKWGIPRDITDVVDTDLEKVYTMDEYWGFPRIVPTQHPVGPFFTYRMWGVPRRFYKDQKNVRVEHWRIAFISCLDSELPPRYRAYIEYYVMWRALTRQGPGQDFKLGGWYKARWDTAIRRINSRVERQAQERTGRLGGMTGGPPTGGPPRPRLPWQFGKRTR